MEKKKRTKKLKISRETQEGKRKNEMRRKRREEKDRSFSKHRFSEATTSYRVDHFTTHGSCCQNNFDFYLSAFQLLLGIFHCIFYQDRRKILLVRSENESNIQYQNMMTKPAIPKRLTIPTTAMAKKLAIVLLFLKDGEGAMVHDWKIS